MKMKMPLYTACGDKPYCAFAGERCAEKLWLIKGKAEKCCKGMMKGDMGDMGDMDDMDDMGGMDDMAAWSLRVWQHTVNMIEHGPQ